MKRIILILILMAFITPFVSAFQLSSGDIFHLTCNNATSGELLGSTATIDCYDSANNNDVSSAAMTNVATGKFRYTFSESDDYYTCYIDCVTGAVDYSIPVWQQSIETNLASVLADTNELQTDNYPSTLSTIAGYIDTEVSDILADTNELQVDDYPTRFTSVDSALTTIDNYIDTEVSAILTDTGTTLDGKINIIDTNVDAILVDTSTTLDNYIDTEIAAILADTGELQTNQGNWVTATGFSTKTDINNVNSSLRTYGDANWATATGFSTLTTSDNIGINWGDITNQGASVDLSATTTFVVDTCSALTANNDKTGYALSTAGVVAINTTLTDAHGEGTWTTGAGGSSPTEAEIYTYFTSGSNEDQFKADVSSLALEATSTDIQQRLKNVSDYKATGFSTHNAADVWSAGSRELSTPNDYKADLSAICLEATAQSIGVDVNTSLVNQGLIQANFSDLPTDTSIDTILTSSHGSGAWTTGSGSSVNIDYQSISNAVWNESYNPIADRTINGTGITATASVNATQIWDEVISGFCTYNSTSQVGSAGQYLCELWKFR